MMDKRAQREREREGGFVGELEAEERQTSAGQGSSPQHVADSPRQSSGSLAKIPLPGFGHRHGGDIGNAAGLGTLAYLQGGDDRGTCQRQRHARTLAIKGPSQQRTLSSRAIDWPMDEFPFPTTRTVPGGDGCGDWTKYLRRCGAKLRYSPSLRRASERRRGERAREQFQASSPPLPEEESAA